jgi:hypothetical protein
MKVQILTEDDIEAPSPIQTQIKPIVETSKTAIILPPKDRVNNIEQKEDAMYYLGLTRQKYILVILEALDATKEGDKKDEEGDREILPDWSRRQWGAEQAAKLFGDYIQHLDANVKVTHSVEELLKIVAKAKAKNVN